MHDDDASRPASGEEMESTAETPSLSSVRPQTARMELLDAFGAIQLAESLVPSKLLGGVSHAGSADGLLAASQEAAERGERVAVVARGESLASSRDAMRRMASARIAIVAHAISGHGGEELAALSDVGWGVLCASGPEDSFDLTLVARRAAEDAGVPFVVVHPFGDAGAPAGRALAMVALPQEKACRAFVGPASRMRPRNDPTHPSFTPSSDRSIAERVPFALGSALREYGDLSGRRHDLFDKTPLGEAPLMLVGMGPVGDALFAATSELRARGYDVGAIHICTLRPFPAARLVKTLARALAITILEPADEPFSHGGLLARELKSAFTDALTWAPGYPGIGRIPKLFCGVTGPSFDAADLAATCDNMLADERGRRSFSFAETEHALPRSPITELPAAAAITMRWVFDDEKTAALALSATAAITLAAIGARTQAIVAGTTLDVIAMREHARGGMARRSPRIVLATELGVASSAAVAPLVPGAVLGVFTWSGDAALPDAARAIVRERRVRALPLPFGGVASNADRGAAMAAACAGAALAVGSRAHRTAIDGALVSRLVTEHVPNGASVAEHARRAYESTLEALVAAERDRDAANDPYRSATAPVS